MLPWLVFPDKPETASMLRYSFVVPIYNDADLAKDFCAQFAKTFEECVGTSDIAHFVELIFVNDGSQDSSAETLSQLPSALPFVRIINLSRNFGQHIALSCGYRHARGQYVGMLNVDMQEHPSQIPLLLKKIESTDCDIVFGLRSKRTGPARDALTSRFFGIVLNKLTGYNVPLNVGTMRVMNRRFVNAYNSLTETSRYLPGLESWLGFKRGYVEITHTDRQRGRSSYNFKRRLLMAADAIISFSDLPLKLTVLVGFVVVVVSLLLAIWLVIERIFFVNMQLGFTSIVCLLILFFGVQLSVIGLASLYIGRVLREVQHRPLYVIRDTVNLEPEQRYA
jgi:glycosyltransferase involved in cell wall biosynthesis